MKVILINALFEKYDDIVKNGNLKSNWPNGLLSIAMYTKKYINNVEFKILDLNVLVNDYFNKSLLLQEKIGSVTQFYDYSFDLTQFIDVDLIGISVNFSSCYYELAGLINNCRNKFSNTPILIGGHFATAGYRFIYEAVDVEAVCYGVGEIPFLEFAQQIDLKVDFTNYLNQSPYWITKEKSQDKVFIPAAAAFVTPDDIPCFDLNIVMNNHLYNEFSTITFGINTSDEYRYMMMTSFGCNYKCIFCAARIVHGRKVRFYSIDRVKADIKKFVVDCGIKRITFSDDHILYDKQRFMDIINYCKEIGIKADVINLSFFSIDQETAIFLRDMGIEEITLAIESGCENTLKNIIHKAAGLKMAKKAVETLHNVGITVLTNIILGFPGETKEMMNESIEGARALGADWYSTFAATPLFGSDLYNICVKNDYLVSDDIFKMNWKKPVIETPDFTPEYVEYIVYWANLYLNFVKNNQMSRGDFNGALAHFERINERVIKNHAFSYYYAAICAEQLNDNEKARKYNKIYDEIINDSIVWRSWAQQFNLLSV